MRDLFVLPLLLSMLALTFVAPYVGVLTWTWLTLMNPHRFLWGILSSLPLNLIVAVVVAIGWALSREPKRLPVNALTVLLVLFVCLMTVTTFFALVPEKSWPLWDRNIKIIALGFLVAAMANNRIRVHALIWVVVISLGYFGVKGGAFTLLTGGKYLVLGPERSPIQDNNHMALALCMVIPLINYLRLQSSVYWIRLGLIAAILFTIVAILGTHSRGGLVGLATVCAYFWWKSDGKLLIAIIGVAALFAGISFMPDFWGDRMRTLEEFQEDSSFRVRMQAWTFAINLALDRPLVGGGFSAGELLSVYRQYLPLELDLEFGRASHSIYFQVLADHGFPGFVVYVLILALLWWQTLSISWHTVNRPELQWMNQLVRMIQVSLLAFYVAGAALSMAYYDLLFIILGVVVSMREMLNRSANATSEAVGAPTTPVGHGAGAAVARRVTRSSPRVG